MFYWSQIPLVRMVLPLLLGIVLYRLNEQLFSPEFLILAVTLLLFALFIFLIRSSWNKYKFRWIFGLAGNFVFLFCGYGLAYYHFHGNAPSIDPPPHSIIWLGELIELPTETNKSTKSIVKILDVADDQYNFLEQNKVLLYVKKDSASTKLEIGDVLIGNSYFNPIEAAQNPTQFDYAKYMSNQNIYLQTYLKEWEKAEQNKNLFAWASKLRESFLEVFKKAGLSGNDFAVASALTLGYDSELDYQMRNAYSGSGSMHILSVSGLHVGIVYLVFSLLTQFMKKNRSLRFVRCLLLLISLWFYAVLTGLSPPVQRSAFMFSFIVLADFMGRNNNIFNSLAASILVLVLINPMILFNVGFQLSYSAVIGIVLIHPKLYPLLEIDNIVLDKIWSLTVVSIAAQLATLPFALYYFHQFPNWFLLTNLIVVPLAFAILIAAILLLLFYSLFSTTIILGSLLKYLVIALNASVLFFYHLPFSVTDGIHINLFTTLLLIFCIVFLITFLHYYKKKFLLLSLSMLCIIAIGQLIENRWQIKQDILTIYDLRNAYAFSSVKGKKAVVLASFSQEERNAETIIQHLDSLGISELDWINQDSLSYFKKGEVFYKKDSLAVYFHANKKEFIIPHMEIIGKLMKSNIGFAYCFITESSYNLPCLTKSKLIFKPSIPDYKRKWMLKEIKDCGGTSISEYRSIGMASTE